MSEAGRHARRVLTHLQKGPLIPSGPFLHSRARCPAMPAELKDIRRPLSLTAGTLKKTATAKDRMFHKRLVGEIADFEERIAAREMYAFVRTSRSQDRSKTGKGQGRGTVRLPRPGRKDRLHQLRAVEARTRRPATGTEPADRARPAERVQAADRSP